MNEIAGIERRSALSSETQEAGARRAGTWRSVRSFALRAAFSLGLLGFLLSRIDRAAIAQMLARERLGYFAAALAVYIAGQALCAYRWQLLARMVGLGGSLKQFVTYYFIGIFTNLFVPGLIGGDAARVLYLGRSRGHIGKAAASVVADRGVGVVALLWFAAACLASLGRHRLPAVMVEPILIAAGLAAAAYLAMPLIAPAMRVLPTRIKKIAELLTPYLSRRAALIVPLVLGITLHGSQVVCQYILGRGLGLQIPFAIFLLCVPVTNALATLPVTLSGLGLREGLYVLLFSRMGVREADAIALGLLWFACIAIGGLFGAPAFMTAELPRPHVDGGGNAPPR